MEVQPPEVEPRSLPFGDNFDILVATCRGGGIGIPACRQAGAIDSNYKSKMECSMYM